MNAVLQSVWNRLKVGECVIVSDEVLDALAGHFHTADGPDADLFFRCLSSIANPNRVGVYDQYVAWIKEKP